MKSIYKLMIFSLALLTTVSCEKLADKNVDPNKSPSARSQEVLTSAQGYMSWTIDGRYNLNNAYQWAQYLTWGPGVSIGNAPRYIAEPDDMNNLWSRTYANALADLNYLIRTGEDSYSAIGKVLRAYVFQNLVDHFNDVPYSQAILGEIADGSILNPSYDGAASIYADLVVQLDQAIDELAVATTAVGSEDLIYGGDLAHWSTFAKSLKLRILMRQSDVVDVSLQVSDLVREGDLMSTSADIASIAFNGSSGDENPMYASQEAGIQFFYVASNTTLEILDGLSDPRLSAFFNEAVNFPGEYRGEPQGTAFEGPLFGRVREDYSQPSAIAYGPAVPTILMSDWEVWFLRAEAAAKFGTADDEATAFANAVTANFDYLGVANPTGYINSLGYDAGASMNERMRQIGTQKWISFNGTQEDEGWIEARRFDTPDNPMFTDISTGIWQTPVRSALPDGVHPTIFLYPQSEQSLNSNAPVQRTLTDKVFWDK